MKTLNALKGELRGHPETRAAYNAQAAEFRKVRANLEAAGVPFQPGRQARALG